MFIGLFPSFVISLMSYIVAFLMISVGISRRFMGLGGAIVTSVTAFNIRDSAAPLLHLAKTPLTVTIN